MGYRSCIKMAITVEKGGKSAKEIVDELGSKVAGSFDGFEIVDDGEREYIKIQDNWVKWYSDFESVKKFDTWKKNLADYFDDNPDLGGFSFSRVGEEPNDSEYEEAGEPLILVQIIHTNSFDDGEDVKQNQFKTNKKTKSRD